MIQRTKHIKVDAILTGDWHLREDQPTCRTDNFWNTQWLKVDFVSKLQQKYDCAVIHSGDLFNHWKPSPYLLSHTMERLPKKFWTIYGNHDLPQHNLDLANKSGIYALEKAGKLKIMKSAHWGVTPTDEHVLVFGHRTVLVWHVMSYIGKLPFPGCTDPKAHALMAKYPTIDLILTGHNHKPFVIDSDGKLLINPGSLSRQATDQMDFKPRVYLWNAKDNDVLPIYIPIDENVVSDEHLKIQKERDSRIDAFVSQLDTDWKAQISFEQNLEIFFKKNKIRNNVKQLIYNAL